MNSRVDDFAPALEFVREMQALAERYGVRPTDERRGTIQDIGSFRRLRLIWDVQTDMAQGYARYVSEQSEVGVDRAPAYELIRKEQRRVPRDWKTRWRDAIADLGEDTRAIITPNGRMLAPKGDKIWILISRFQNPWEPFDFNSGMGLRQVRRKVAERLGVIEPGEKIEVKPMDFNGDVKASLRGISPAGRERLREVLGGEVEIEGEQIRLRMSQRGSISGIGGGEGLTDKTAGGPILRGLEPAGVDVRERVLAAELSEERLDAWNGALNRVAEVHGDGLMLPAWVRDASLEESISAHGLQYTLVRPDGSVSGSSIALAHGSRGRMKLAATEEFAHHLDGLSAAEMSTRSPKGEMLDILNVLEGSKQLRAIRNAADLDPNRKHYLTRRDEVFARFYVQFIAEETRDQDMLGMIDRLNSSWSTFDRHQFWSGEEIISAKRAFVSLLKRLGWVRDISQPQQNSIR